MIYGYEVRHVTRQMLAAHTMAAHGNLQDMSKVHCMPIFHFS